MRVKTRFTLLSLCVIAALLLGAWQPVLAQETPDEPAPQGIRYDAPPYAVDGPYAVGVRYFTIPAAVESDRELTATVWYPAQPPEGDISEIVYELQFPTGQFPPFSVLGDAQLDAPSDASGAPYPLVVYSHAHWSMGQEVPYFVEHLASRGFVVISVDHEDNWSTDMGPMAFETMIRRPQEVTRQIDFAEELSAPDGELAGLIATDKVGVAGWSMGGITSMALAGARLDLAGLRAWCEANPTLVEENSFACIDMLDHEAEMAEFAGLDAIPIGLWPTTQDDRIAAAVRLSGSLFMYGSEGMAAVDVPVMLFHGGGEAIADPGLQVGDPYTSVAAPRKAEVVLDHASHMVFFSSCDEAPDMVAIGFPMFCTDPVWDMDRAHDLINHFATAFLLAELKGDAEAAAALAPENVSFPGIEYQAEGYAPAAPAATLDEATIAKIEAMVEEMMADTGTPGYALGIVKDGQIVYTKGFGVERVGEDKPVTEHTVFGTGCVGKPAVATAIMQLVDAGKIDLDAPVTDYLPYFKLADERYKEITIRQLITNRSGLPDVEDWFSPPVEYEDGVLERYVRSLDNTKLLFAPGQRWYYTGMGYIVLADVIQKVTGQTFEDYLQQHILDPLGMEDTLLIVGEADQAHVAGNHVHDNAGEVVVSDIFPYRRQFAAAAPLFSSISDLARYALAHLNRGELDGQRILPAADYDAMWEPISAMNSPLFPALQAHYGMGWFVGALDGHRAVGHFGADEGYAALMLLAPDDNAGLVLASNFFDWDEFDIRGWETGIDIMKMLLAEGE
jgi:CubicO group peptidase (beta-lactamase class C family)/predicted dienelactone hydrolase